MNSPAQLAQHLRQVHTGGNWTWSNLRDQLADVTWEQAVVPVHGFNTIATLVFHVGYFVEAVLPVLRGGPLNAKDELSFAHPPIASQQDWEAFVGRVMENAETLATLIEAMPESRLWDTFSEEKYGNYYRNLLGIIEHTHYHLGQIALIKKLVQAQG